MFEKLGKMLTGEGARRRIRREQGKKEKPEEVEDTSGRWWEGDKKNPDYEKEESLQEKIAREYNELVEARAKKARKR